MPGMETIKIHLLAAASLLHDAQDISSNLASKRSWRIILGYLHKFHAASWSGLRGASKAVGQRQCENTCALTTHHLSVTGCSP